MSISAKLTFTHPSLGTQERVWEGMDKVAATHLQLGLTDTLADMGKSALRVYAGKDKKADGANPGQLSINFVLTEDGVVWAGPQNLIYPNVPAAAVALFKGFLDGNMAAAPKEVRERERKGKH